MEAIIGSLVGVTIGLVQVAKGLGLADKFAPVVAIIVATALSFLVFEETRVSILYGVMIGLSAVGMYSGTKNLKEQYQLYKTRF